MIDFLLTMFDLGLSRRKRLLLCFVSIAALILFINISLLSKADLSAKLKNIAIIIPSLERTGGQKGTSNSEQDFTALLLPSLTIIVGRRVLKHGTKFEVQASVNDHHPIVALMRKADESWTQYD